MKSFDSICLGLILQGSLLLIGVTAWSQDEQRPVPVPAATGPASNASADSDASTSVDDSSGRMVTPPPVSGQSYPIMLTSQERSNYLRGGLAFTSAYTDNAVPVDGHPVSDVSYSVWPTVALDETTTRSHLVLSYAPGFTFYQRESSLNEADENASINFQYRLSPHVTFSARDGFQKSSSVFNQPDLASAAAVSGGTEVGNFSVIAPIADRLSNTGNVGITYQFAANSMVGAGGTFTNLHYPDQAEVPGLFDSVSQGGLAFYSVRVSRINYFGATYQYQRLASYPAPGTNETQTHALLLFYTVYPTKRFSISLFGGPQYAEVGPQFSNTVPPSPPACMSSGVLPAGCPTPASRSWNPSAGGSLGWQGHLSSAAISYAHLISSGGGLIGAVKTDNVSASIRQQLRRTLSATVAGGYADNDILAAATLTSGNGHTVSGTASLQQLFGQHLNVQLGYTRLHQDYSTVAVLAATPDTNREFVSISYQFSRPLGR
ncbi:MAG: hypothetical protein WA651_10340 [Candidatus Sulfotelmatobacter sp.]